MKLAIGTVQFGLDYGVSNNTGQTSQKHVKAILNYSQKQGITLLDTAAAYGDAEKVLGRANVKDFELVSKLPPIKSDSSSQQALAFAENSLQTTLKNLQSNHIYGYLYHHCEDMLTYASVRNWLTVKQQQGVIYKIGVSVYSPEQAANILEHCHIDLIQIPLNLFDQRFIHSGMLKRLKDKGVEVHVRSAFLQGLLLMNKTQRPSYFKGLASHFQQLDKLCTENNLSQLAVALNFVMQQPQVDKVVVGVNNQAQLAAIIQSLNLPLPKCDWQRLSCENEAFINPSLWQI
ncbi:General stress protein 69 [Pseudoalteromonas sp. P1-9]|uniref:aldo/keto reductase n=1 Tax=Pseudoalteromonas sp. P1-9 TaxID=1710354 RepID=UPI0006D5ED3A|nr:aldo/keto reductase [Pseudoalteromonas sp. P1-9]KPV97318.1 General stress protein 69 [Pseudoalteromonas sp. P1-9]